MKQVTEIVLDHIGAQGDDGYPARQVDWPAWPCPGCGQELRDEKVPVFDDFSTIQAYTKAKACSSCVPDLLSKFLPRDEILALAGVPIFEREKRWDPEKAYNAGEEHLPWDRTRPGEPQLELWPGSERERTIVLLGKNGVGKTMLSTQLLVQAYRSGVRSLAWFKCSDIVAEHFGSSPFDDKTRAERARRCGCLVLDEYGRGQHSNSFAFGLIGDIIDSRKGKLTIITSNLGFKSTGKGLSFEETDSAVFDRLTEGLVIQMTGKSQRGRA